MDELDRLVLTLRSLDPNERPIAAAHAMLLAADELQRLLGLLMDKCPCGRPGSEHIIECPEDSADEGRK